ncbi:MAG: amino acid permease [Segetibacter sp.]
MEFFSIIQTATIAAVGVAFAKFTTYIFPVISEDAAIINFGLLKVSSAQLLSIVVIVLLTYINSRGVKSGKIVQTTFTLAKLLSLFSLIVVGLMVTNSAVWHSNWQNAWSLRKLNPNGTFETYSTIAAAGAVAAAMVGSVFSSDAWNNVTFIAGEIKNPKRNIGLSLFLGTLIVTLIYISTNLVYTAVLPLHAIATASKDRVGVAASEVIFGTAGTIIIALMIMVSTFGCNNGLILSGARVYYTMAKDGLFFHKAGTLNKYAVPSYALWLQCLVACTWSLSGHYGELLDMISFVVVCFYMLTIAGIFILRKTQPDIDRPYKAIGYPVLPVLYIIMGICFCLLLIVYKPRFTWPGLIITLLGIPVYYLINTSRKKNV